MFLLLKKNIGELLKAFKTALEKGWLRSIKYKDFQIELSALEQFRLVEISSPTFKSYSEFRKSGYNELFKMIENTFLSRKLYKILNVNLSQTIYSAPLYLYVRRLYEFFDLELIVFHTDMRFIGILGIREFIYFKENKYPSYFFAYHNALNKVLSKNLPVDAFNDKKQIENEIINAYRKERGHSDFVDANYVETVFGNSLFTRGFELGDKVTKSDFMKIKEFPNEFIPITEDGKYKSTLEKQYMLQEVFFDICKDLLKD
jgi:hypothetical protein